MDQGNRTIMYELGLEFRGYGRVSHFGFEGKK